MNIHGGASRGGSNPRVVSFTHYTVTDSEGRTYKSWDLDAAQQARDMQNEQDLAGMSAGTVITFPGENGGKGTQVIYDREWVVTPEEAKGGRNWLKTTSDVFGAAGIGGTVKGELIDFAVRDYSGLNRNSYNQLSDYSKTVREVGALGASGTKYLKYSKGIGVLGNVVGVTSAGVQLMQNPSAGNATRLAVQSAAIGAAFIPVIGWGVSLGIGAADLIWGDDFYNWIDK